jgi:hypothetical protein
MCGKQRSYKSFAFVSAVTKGVTGAFSVSAANTGLRREAKKFGEEGERWSAESTD